MACSILVTLAGPQFHQIQSAALPDGERDYSDWLFILANQCIRKEIQVTELSMFLFHLNKTTNSGINLYLEIGK